MIVLDTNVVGELMRPDGAARVRAWANGQDPAVFCLAAVVLAEIAYGIARTQGRRRADLEARLARMRAEAFEDRVLPLDERAAAIYGERAAALAGEGRVPPVADGLIAATALVHGAAVATRDVGPFAAMGVEVIDPWDEDV